MNYIYDCITNFFNEYYDFFEWDKKDNLTHFKKIPIIKVTDNEFKTIFTNNIQIDNELLKKIKNKSEIYQDKFNKDKYYLLITNNESILALMFNNNGQSIKRSSLYVDEELDIITTLRRIDYKTINYQIINKLKPKFKTRNDVKIEEYLLKELNKLSIKKDNDKITYLYYECFNKYELNTKKALNILIKNINNTNISNILYNFFKLSKPINK